MKNEEEYLNVMDLFAGIGGAAYAGHLIRNWRTVCYVEWDKYCQEVIQARIREGFFDDAPIWDDVKTFDGSPWAGSVDIITAGFPCQPFSVAGQRRGKSDERNMWPETLRIIDEVQPRFAFLENVPGLITSGYFGRILGDLSEIGYDARWTIVSAADVGAPHRRKRLWVLAYPAIDRNSGNPRGFPEKEQGQELHDVGKSIITGEISWWDIDPADIPDTEGSEGPGRIEKDENGRGDAEPGGQNPAPCFERFGQPQSLLGRVAHGIPNRCNRVKGIGNAWVPAVAATAWNILIGGFNENRDG